MSGVGAKPTKSALSAKRARRRSKSTSGQRLSYKLSPSPSGFIINFQKPRFDVGRIAYGDDAGDLASRDPLHKYALVLARETGDISQQIQALDIRPGTPVSDEVLPTVISDVKIIMGDVFGNNESADRFLNCELSPVSGKPWIDAIAAGEIATFLVSLNEMKYGSRG